MDRATELTRRRYNRISGLYDVMDRMMGDKEDEWRLGLLSTIEGQDILEVGVGTGRNLARWTPLSRHGLPESRGPLQFLRGQVPYFCLAKHSPALPPICRESLFVTSHHSSLGSSACVLYFLPRKSWLVLFVRGSPEQTALWPVRKLSSLEQVETN